MAMERHGKDRRLPYFVAVTYIVNDKRLDEAKQLLEKYLAGPIGAEDPSRAQGRLWLGRLYEKENEFSKAEEEYRKAIELDGGLKEAKEALRKVRKKE
jgi:cytochrome c-type biogenesis protein CcmH/NrfG